MSYDYDDELGGRRGRRDREEERPERNRRPERTTSPKDSVSAPRPRQGASRSQAGDRPRREVTGGTLPRTGAAGGTKPVSRAARPIPQENRIRAVGEDHIADPAARERSTMRMAAGGSPVNGRKTGERPVRGGEGQETSGRPGRVSRTFQPQQKSSSEGNGYGRRTPDGGRVTATSQAAEKAAKTAKNKKRRRIITMAVAECIALIFIFTYAYFARAWSMIARPDDWNVEEVTNPEFSVDVPEYMKGHWTIAVFGVDSRDKNVLKGTNSDVIMICDINQDTGEIKIVSVFRDTYLNTDDEGTYNKINSAYFTGGPTQAVKALNRNLDLNITDYVTFNWNAVADGINVLGGIDIELSNAEFYYINSFITETVKGTGIGSHQLTHAGMNHLDGVQAVAYGRLRLMDTDYARTERQRKVIQAAFDKAVKADWNTLNSLVGAVFPQVSTYIDINDIFPMLRNITQYHIGETAGFPFSRTAVNMGKKGDCVIPTTLESNVIKLHEFLYGEMDYTPSDTVKGISEKISSDTGLYKEGQTVGHVSTDNGVIPSSKASTTAAETEVESTEETTEEYETDEYGNRIDENGNIIDEDDQLYDEPIETDVDGNEIIDGEYFGENGEWIGGDRRPTTTVPSTEGGTRPSSPAESTESTRPYPGGPGASETTEGIGPGTGLEPGPGNSQGPGIIDNSSEGTDGYVPEGPGAATSPGDTTSSESPIYPGSSTPGGNVSVSPVPTEDYENIGPGM